MYDHSGEGIIFIIFTIVIILYSVVMCKFNDKKQNENEYTKQLEQSLAEQIQETEVYINILERSSND